MTELRGTELAYATLDYIKAHPEEWRQADFFCGTTACFAGRAILLATGFTTERQFREWQSKLSTDERCHTAQIALRLLGWAKAQGYHVFYHFTDDYGDLEKRVTEAINNEVDESEGELF